MSVKFQNFLVAKLLTLGNIFHYIICNENWKLIMPIAILMLILS